MRSGLEINKLAKDLLAMLTEMNVITPESTFISVKTNVPLNTAIFNSIALGLSEEVGNNRYGLGIVSDFDFHFNMSTDKKFNNMLDTLKFDRNRPEYLKLKANRTNLRAG